MNPRQHLEALVRSDVKRAIDVNLLVTDPLNCWAGGGRQSPLMLGTGFDILRQVLRQHPIHASEIYFEKTDVSRYGHAHMQFLEIDSTLHMIATLHECSLPADFTYKMFVLSQVHVMAAAEALLKIGQTHINIGLLDMRDKIAITEFMMHDRGMEWVSPMPTHAEACRWLSITPLDEAKSAVENGVSIFEACDMIPEDHKWSLTALKAHHYLLTKGKR